MVSERVFDETTAVLTDSIETAARLLSCLFNTLIQSHMHFYVSYRVIDAHTVSSLRHKHNSLPLLLVSLKCRLVLFCRFPY